MPKRTKPEFLGAAPWIACTNLSRSVEHDREALGFRGEWHWFWGEPPDHAGVSRGRTRILLFEDSDRAARGRGAEVVIYVAGVAALYDQLHGTGARVVRELAERGGPSISQWRIRTGSG